jgi:hypothetical protein
MLVTEAMMSLVQEMQRTAIPGRMLRPLATASQEVSGRAKVARWEWEKRRPAQALGQAMRRSRPERQAQALGWARLQRAWLPRARQERVAGCDPACMAHAQD